MPYYVGKSASCPKAKPWACYKKGGTSDKVMGCHESKEKAQAQQRALYAAENKK